MIEAAIIDKPIITIGFDGFEKKVPYVRSMNRLHTEEGFAVLLDTGATVVVKDKEELGVALNAYLKDPSKDREKRKAFLANHFKHFDGKSVEHLAKFILDQLHTSDDKN